MRRKKHKAERSVFFSGCTLQDTKEGRNICLRNHAVGDAGGIFQHAVHFAFECLGDECVRICAAQGEEIEWVVIQAHTDGIHDGRDMLTHISPIGTGTVKMDFPGRREQPALFEKQILEIVGEAALDQVFKIVDLT